MLPVLRPPAVLRLLPLAALVLAACTGETADVDTPAGPVEPVATNDIVAAANDAGLTTLIELAETAGLTATLQGEGPYTVFAPTNEAFAALPQSLRDSLQAPSGRARLARLLKYHVVPGRIEANMAPIGVNTLEGDEITLDGRPDAYVVRDGQGMAVQVVRPDVNVTNGVVHVIDRVLMPPASDGP